MGVVNLKPYVFRHGKRRSELRQLRRLKTDRPQHEPRMRSLDIRRQEDRGDQQEHDKPIDEISEHVEEIAIQHQDHEDQHKGGRDPDQLHARTPRRIEQANVVKFIAGATNTEPSRHDQ